MNTKTLEHTKSDLPPPGWRQKFGRLSCSLSRAWVILLVLMALAPTTSRALEIIGITNCSCTNLTIELSGFPQGAFVATLGGVVFDGTYDYANQTIVLSRPGSLAAGNYLLCIWQAGQQSTVPVACTNVFVCTCLPCECPAGPQGPAGPTGAIGPRGPSGTNGLNGLNGTNGVNGTNGLAGARGPAGTNGVNGTNGLAGPAGPTGPTGAMGPPGPIGPAGATGPAGPAGTNGVNGTNGLAGARGPAGTNGVNGTNGLAGPAGPTGPTGAMGPAGPIGPAGATGPAGPAGTNGVNGTNGLAGPAGPAGPGGPAGATGPAGPIGPAGATGPAGPAGTNGVNGTNGLAGPAGPAGPGGPAGATGPAGPAGATGAVGPEGATGAVGPEGPTGPTGPAGTNGLNGTNGTSGSSQYAYVYNLLGTTVAIEADVPFSNNGILTSGITHAPGNAGVSFTSPGDYKVTYSVSGVEPAQFALFINGAQVPGTVYGSGAGTQQDNGQVIIRIAAADVLTLRNHSSAAAVTLQTLAGGTQINVNASLLIQKLN